MEKRTWDKEMYGNTKSGLKCAQEAMDQLLPIIELISRGAQKCSYATSEQLEHRGNCMRPIYKDASEKLFVISKTISKEEPSDRLLEGDWWLYSSLSIDLDKAAVGAEIFPPDIVIKQIVSRMLHVTCLCQEKADAREPGISYKPPMQEYFGQLLATSKKPTKKA